MLCCSFKEDIHFVAFVLSSSVQAPARPSSLQSGLRHTTLSGKDPAAAEPHGFCPASPTDSSEGVGDDRVWLWRQLGFAPLATRGSDLRSPRVTFWMYVQVFYGMI